MILSNFCEFIPVFQSPDIKSVHLVCVKKYFLKQWWYHGIPCVFSLHFTH